MSNILPATLINPINPLLDSSVSTIFNSFLVNILLLGIYTTIYFSTIRLYLNGTIKRSPIVVLALTALYLLNVEQTAVQWFWLNTFFENSGEPKLAAYLYANVGPSWSYLATNINAFLLAFIADSLLIWRCYIVWSNSVRVILLPCTLLILEIGTGIANIVKISIARLNPNIYTSGNDLRIQTTLALFSSFAQTLVTTSLILYRILSVTRETKPVLGRAHSARTYKAIIDLIIQSAVGYSLALLIWGIAWASLVSGGMHHYIKQICLISAGLAPTVMVARSTLASSQARDLQILTPHISDMEFQPVNRDVSISVPTPPNMPPAHEYS